LLNEYTDFEFKRLIRQSDSLKVTIGRLEWFRNLHFFSWLLLKKVQDKTLKQFKLIKIGDGGLVYPVQVADRQAIVKVEEGKISMPAFAVIGQELEKTFEDSQKSQGKDNIREVGSIEENESETMEVEEGVYDDRFVIKIN
jgi:hypothetical protein